MSEQPGDWLDRVAAAVSGVEEPDLPDTPDAVVQFAVSGAPLQQRSFHVSISAGEVSVTRGRHPDADVVLGWTHAELQAVLAGHLQVEVAYMTGQMKLEGDRVLFNPEDRYEVEVRGRDYIILRERDVHAVAAERLDDASTGLYL